MRKLAIQAARSGGRVLMQKFGRVLDLRHKGTVDLVTDADLESESAIVEVLRGAFPHHDILAEEGDYGPCAGKFRWIIDPLDGTTNYAHGFPWFAVSIALAIEGQISLGVIYNPFHQELFVAEQGRGAFLNNTRICVSANARLADALLSTGFPYDRKESPVNNFDHFVNFQRTAFACRRVGSASLDLAYVAAGRLDGFWEMKLKPWDVAAGKLLVEEAGGKISDFDGGGFDIYGNECLASNGLIHREMTAILKTGRRP